MTTSAAPRRWGCGKVLLLVYLALLAASHLWRWLHPTPAPVAPPAVARLEMAELAADGSATGRPIEVAYWSWAPEGQPKDTLLLLHGSPGGGGDFVGMGPALAARGFRVIAPDLPGFGFSSRELADYSFRNHARYCEELLRRLGVERVQVVGYSMGGGVALHLAADEPERVRSLILLSSIGVQELELLGIYAINHAVHGAQLLGLRLLFEGFPHFGLFDGGMLNVEYARNFYDSDQRPLRQILEELEQPTLILHGERDMLAPYAAAVEHHRLVPQSQLITFDADHFMVYEEPGTLVAPIADFAQRVAAGEGKARSEADADRVAEAAAPAAIRQPAAKGPTLLVWMALLALATLVSEDLTCIATGLLVARGAIGLGAGAFACGAGIFIGDLMLYALGRLGRPWIERGFLRRLVKDRDISRSRRFLEKRGALMIFLSRFMPGTRLPMYVTCGLLGMPLARFAVALLIPVALWTPLLVGLSSLLGEKFFAAFERFEANALPAFLALAFGLWSGLALLRSLLSWEGRRRWVGRFQRWRHWEFWPPWAFYPPLVVYLVFLALRYRRPTLFTAANPGMPGGGGFVGESKSEILARLDPAAVAPWRLLPDGTPATRRAVIADFQREQGVDYPVVLKPDVGQRGSGVVVARAEADLESFLESTPGPAIVQRYVAGPELGIFYTRLPSETAGSIFSITDKQLPVLLGDGVSTLRRLILADRRAVAMADTYLERWREREEEVPAAGERWTLVDLGTHCRGSVFVDGAEYRTPELEAAVDRIAKSYQGFYFGRFDFRAPSFEHFRRGEGLQVLELNGVTSEATHIYDRRNSVFEGWRVLRRQWRLAYAIGAENAERGHAPASLRELWRLVREFRRRSAGADQGR